MALNGLQDFANNLENRLGKYNTEFIRIVDVCGIDWENTQEYMALVDQTQHLICTKLVELRNRNSVTEMIGRINLQFQYLDEELQKYKRLEQKKGD